MSLRNQTQRPQILGQIVAYVPVQSKFLRMAVNVVKLQKNHLVHSIRNINPCIALGGKKTRIKLYE